MRLERSLSCPYVNTRGFVLVVGGEEGRKGRKEERDSSGEEEERE